MSQAIAPTVVHLTGSPFVGGPEQQMLGLAEAMPAGERPTFLLFKDKGQSRAFQDELVRRGLGAVMLEHDAPQYRATIDEIAARLVALGAKILCCHGYKADLLGWRAARKVGCKLMALSHGWTASTWKVRLNEALDRWALRRFDRVACVSAAQADKVRRAGVSPGKIVVIRNAVNVSDAAADSEALDAIKQQFVEPKRWLIGAAGRFSPEKGYGLFVEAAARVRQTHPAAGFVLFGRGPLLGELEDAVRRRGLGGHFVFGGFRTNLPRLWPGFDAAVLPSFTEGLPVMVLEAFAAKVPVVATAVGGTPEVIREGVDGYLVPSGDATGLADRLGRLLDNDDARREMGRQGRRRIEEDFTFAAQARAYRQLFDELTGRAGDSAATAAATAREART